MNAYSGLLGHQSWPEALAAGWVGGLDRVDPDGVVEGWCWRPDAPASRASIVLKVDGVPVASARCDCMRPDLAAAGFGDGAYGFLVVLPDDIVRAGIDAAITLHDAETGRLLDRPRPLLRDMDPRPRLGSSPAQQIEGNLDGVSEKGIVTGWCWHPMQPSSRASVTIAVDGHVIGTIRADGARPDLLKAGIGDGSHGFSFALPSSLLDASGIVTIAVADAATGQGFGVPCVANPGRLSATNELVADLEHDIRRLQADYAALTAQIAHREATAPAHDFLATLGILFTDLAAEHASRTHVAKRESACDIAVHDKPSLVLAITAEPCATIIVPASADLPCVMACLASLHALKIDERAEIIIVVSKNALSEFALLHGLVGNLHLVENRSAHLDDAITKLARPNIPVIVLAPIVRPTSTWLDLLIATAARHSNAGIIGGRVVGEYDELLRHTALDADLDDMPVDTGAFDRADKFASRHLRCVEAVGCLGFLITERGNASLRQQSAIARNPFSLGDDALDICLRIRQTGLDVMVQPQARAVCADDVDIEPYIPDLHRSSQQLRAAWNNRTPLRSNRGTALLIVDDIPPKNDPSMLARLDALHALRLNVVVASTSRPGSQEASGSWLEASGAALLDNTDGGSIGAYLYSAGSDINLIEFLSGAPPDGLLQRVRTMSPSATIIGAEPDRSWQQLTPEKRLFLRELGNSKETMAAHSDHRGIAIIADFTDNRQQEALQILVTEILPAIDVIHLSLPVLVIATKNSCDIVQGIVGIGGSRVTVQSLTDDSLRRLHASQIVILPKQKTGPIQAYSAAEAERAWFATTAPIAIFLAAELPISATTSAQPSQQVDSHAIAWGKTLQDVVQLIIAAHHNFEDWTERFAEATEQYRLIFQPAATAALYADFVCNKILTVPVTPPA